MLSALFNRFRRAKCPSLSTLDPLQLLGYYSTTRLLEQAHRLRLLPTASVHSVCDFGSGTGGPALAAQHFFEVKEKRLTLLESHLPQARTLRALFPQATVHCGDGIEWLTSTHHHFDLITTFMIGPEYEDTGLVRRLMAIAFDRLSAQGCVIITSDTATMRVVKSIATNVCLPGKQWHANWLIPKTPEEQAQFPAALFLGKTERPQAMSAGVHLPEPVRRRTLVADLNGTEAWEEHALSTEFERAYLAATIESLSLQCPDHPGLPALEKLLTDSIATTENGSKQTFSSILQAIRKQ